MSGFTCSYTQTLQGLSLLRVEVFGMVLLVTIVITKLVERFSN